MITVEKLKEKKAKNSIEYTFLGCGKYDNTTQMRYGGRGVPQFVIISPQRKLLDRWMGYKSRQILDRVEKKH